MAPTTRGALDKSSAEDRPALLDNGKPYTMPTNTAGLKKELRCLLHEKEELRMTNLQLAKRVASAEKGSSKKKKNVKELNKIKDCVEQCVFHKIQFIQNNTAKEKAALMVYNILYPEDAHQDLQDNHQEIWIATYADNIVTDINNYRSYAQDCHGVKNACIKKYYKANKTMPPLEMVKRAAKRELDHNVMGEYAFMEWYWKELCSKYLSFCRLSLFVNTILTNATSILANTSLYLCQ